MSKNCDELLFPSALLVFRFGQGSVSMLQRKLNIGYIRAARIIEELESAGIVGKFDGVAGRAVLVKSKIELEQKLTTITNQQQL